MRSRRMLPVLLIVLGSGAAQGAAPLSGILNYRAYSDTFASAGQPLREQFQLLRDAGFERVVYLAFSNSGDGMALADEDVVVKELGMSYLHIPVDFAAPQPAEFETFAAYMQQDPEAARCDLARLHLRGARAAWPVAGL